MSHQDSSVHFKQTQDGILCLGDWSLLAVPGLLHQLKQLRFPETDTIIIDGSDLSHFDSAGAMVLNNWAESLKSESKQIRLNDFTKQQKALLELIDKHEDNLNIEAAMIPSSEPVLASIGKETIEKAKQADDFVILLGDLSCKLFEAFGNWKRFQLPSIFSIMYSAGLQALPILALLSFLIGVVLAYQMGLQLQTYGANNFIAYLSGMAIFREFGPLITAIIVAGRTSSAFTAQIGNMTLNEEVDAIRTMGLSPTELLVVPKVLGMLIMFPLLIFWSDLFSIFGAMYMSKWKLGISYADFLIRLRNAVGLKQLMLGLYKAPTFALLTSLVGCFQGFRVSANADTIGSQTTRSVVQALFLIIVTDAVYSVIYSWLDL